MAGAVWRIFQPKAPELMWPTDQNYVLPVIMYGSPGWNALLGRDSKLIKKIRRRFTKNVTGLYQLTYVTRLRRLRVLTLEQRKLHADNYGQCVQSSL